MEILFLVLAFLVHGTANTETEVTGVSGENIIITCSRNDIFIYIKCFCVKNCDHDDDILIESKEKMRWYSKGRYSIIDEGKTFRVKISQLTKKDAGTYWCGWKHQFLKDIYEKVVLTVREGTTKPPTNPPEEFPSTPSSKSNLMLLVVAVTCAVPICVCLCTLILLVTRKAQQVIPQQNVQMSSNYENVMPAFRSEGHCGASSSQCIAHLEDAPREPTVEDQEYAGYLSVSEYVDLKLSQVEEHVYHDVGTSKEIPKGKQILKRKGI